MVEVKIYTGHSSSIDFRNKLYKPLKGSSIAEKHKLILPHDSDEFFNSKSFLQNDCDLFVAEVSRASTGLGIELGWADEYSIPVAYVHQEGADPSPALEVITDRIHSYGSKDELVEIVREVVEAEN